MISKEFVSAVSSRLGIERLDLIEKDLLLHRILTGLYANKMFSSRFLFKGGTCLIKAYYGYKRFSEDIDFTWVNQKEFEGLSQKRIRTRLSEIIGETGAVFESIAKSAGLDFKCEKGNGRFVELTGSNKVCTFKIWYISSINGRESFIKVQINFVELLCFKPKRKRLGSLLGPIDKELMVLFPEAVDYYKTPVAYAYDIREILSEKIRAILTRRGMKARDFLDIYFIYKMFGIQPEEIKQCAERKLRFILGLYARYRTNLREKIKLIDGESIFRWGEERDLLLTEIDENEFHEFVEQLEAFLKEVAKEADFYGIK